MGVGTMTRILAALVLGVCMGSANAATIDIVFATDSSSSVGLAGWMLEQGFVRELINSIDAHEDGTNEYRFAVIDYSNLAVVVWQLTDSQDPLSDITDAVNSHPSRYQGSVSRADRAVSTAIDVFIDAIDNAGPVDAKYLMLIADGLPTATQGSGNPSPCPFAPTLNDLAINTTVIGVGLSLREADAYECIVDDPGDIIMLEGFDQTSFDAALPLILSQVVPIPAAAYLLCSALALLGWMRRKAT